jgi:hypothetical protein
MLIENASVLVSLRAREEKSAQDMNRTFLQPVRLLNAKYNVCLPLPSTTGSVDTPPGYININPSNHLSSSNASS